jgi:hypothetical protein
MIYLNRLPIAIIERVVALPFNKNYQSLKNGDCHGKDSLYVLARRRVLARLYREISGLYDTRDVLGGTGD